jgi:poly(A)-specific ribonuclease
MDYLFVRKNCLAIFIDQQDRMEVTRENFAAVVDDFCDLAATCDFFAIDEEMTGINLQDSAETPLMTIRERYAIKKQVAERYNIIQVGVCLFHKLPNEQQQQQSSSATKIGNKPVYVARPFNFFLFPSSVEDNSGGIAAGTPMRSDVVLSSSAIAFLRRHGMDFQRWVYKGVPYCNGPQEVFLRKQFTDAEETAANAVIGNAKDAEWIAEGLHKAEAFSGYDPRTPNAISEMMLPPTKSRAARDALKLAVEKKFCNLLVAIRGRGAQRDAILVRVTPEEKQRKVNSDLQIRERSLLDSIGFRKVFQALTQTGKPCVGHNCFADILFLFAALDEPLAENLTDFKSRLDHLLPTVFDTKFIATDNRYFPAKRFDSTHLGGLHDAYVKNPLVDVRLPLGFQGYHEKTLVKLGSRGAAHEAGYDALMTGTVLLNLLEEAKLDMESAKREVGNKVAVFRSLYALDADASGPDEKYLPKGPVVLVEHKKGTPLSELESCVNGIATTSPVSDGSATKHAAEQLGVVSPCESLGLTFMPVSETSTVIAPMVHSVHQDQMDAVARQLNTAEMAKAAVPYKATFWERPRFANVSRCSSANAGIVANSPRSVLRRMLASAVRKL